MPLLCWTCACAAEGPSASSSEAGAGPGGATTASSGNAGVSAVGGSPGSSGATAATGNLPPSGASAGGSGQAPGCSSWSAAIGSGRTLLCIGQDTGEIEEYSRAFGAPGGVMLYTNVSDLAGFGEEVDFGTGRQSLQHWLAQPSPLALQLAVSLMKSEGGSSCTADHAAAVAGGEIDGALSSMALELLVTRRPVLLRFGYEFDNSACRSYEPNQYRLAFRHFVEVFRTLGVTNVKFVWNAWGGPPLDVSPWYPGDDVVDYVGVSVFPVGLEPGKLDRIAAFAAEHQKPLMVAESAPQAQNPLSNPGSWAWFESLLGFVARHDVRVLSYINQDWNRQSVWAQQGIWGDSRLQGSALENNWRAAISHPRFINSSESLYRELGCTP